MKVIAVNGGPRKNWNTATLLQNALDGAKSTGAQTEVINLLPHNNESDLIGRFRYCLLTLTSQVFGATTLVIVIGQWSRDLIDEHLLTFYPSVRPPVIHNMIVNSKNQFSYFRFFF